MAGQLGFLVKGGGWWHLPRFPYACARARAWGNRAWCHHPPPATHRGRSRAGDAGHELGGFCGRPYRA